MTTFPTSGRPSIERAWNTRGSLSRVRAMPRCPTPRRPQVHAAGLDRGDGRPRGTDDQLERWGSGYGRAGAGDELERVSGGEPAHRVTEHRNAARIGRGVHVLRGSTGNARGPAE